MIPLLIFRCQAFPKCWEFSGSKLVLEEGEQFVNDGEFIIISEIHNITTINSADNTEYAVSLLTSLGAATDLTVISSMGGKTTVYFADNRIIHGIIFSGFQKDLLYISFNSSYEYTSIPLLTSIVALYYINSDYDATLSFKQFGDEVPVLLIDGAIETDLSKTYIVKGRTSISIEVAAGSVFPKIEFEDLDDNYSTPINFPFPDYIEEKALFFGYQNTKTQALLYPIHSQIDSQNTSLFYSMPPRITFNITLAPFSNIFFPGSRFEKITIRKMSEKKYSVIEGIKTNGPFAIEPGTNETISVEIVTIQETGYIDSFIAYAGFCSSATKHIVGTLSNSKTYEIGIGEKILTNIITLENQELKGTFNSSKVKREFINPNDKIFDMFGGTFTHILWYLEGIDTDATIVFERVVPSDSDLLMADYHISNIPSVCFLSASGNILKEIEFENEADETNENIAITIDRSNPIQFISSMQTKNKKITFSYPKSSLLIKKLFNASININRIGSDGSLKLLKAYSYNESKDIIEIESGYEDGMIIEINMDAEDSIFEGYGIYTPDVDSRIVGTIKEKHNFLIRKDEITSIMMTSSNENGYSVEYDKKVLSVYDYLTSSSKTLLELEEEKFEEDLIVKIEMINKDNINGTFSIENSGETEKSTFIEYSIPKKLSIAMRGENEIKEVSDNNGDNNDEPNDMWMIIGIVIGSVIGVTIIAVIVYLAVAGKGCFGRKVAAVGESELKNLKGEGSSEESYSEDE